MCYMYRTEQATTLSGYSLMVRMPIKLLGVTIVGLTTSLTGYGNALRWLQYTVAYVTILLKRVTYCMALLKTELLGSQ